MVQREGFRERCSPGMTVTGATLPWRASRDPYRVWLSEIMLQQTRVAAVIEHYQEFLRRFPTVKKLAAARESSVLAAWSGLGYYRRARMLHAAAKVIVRQHGGELPSTEQELRALPALGRTPPQRLPALHRRANGRGRWQRGARAAANLGKQLSGKALWTAAGKLLDPNRPGDFNQAMMELGAVVCYAACPACLTCPVVHSALRGRIRGKGKGNAAEEA